MSVVDTSHLRDIICMAHCEGVDMLLKNVMFRR